MQFNQCQTCIHLMGYFPSVDDVVCEAFPRGIPAEIYAGDFDHTQAHPNDFGVRYEPQPGAEPVAGTQSTEGEG